jgi:hypothetical protein
MGATFWSAMLLGVILGFVASVLANISTPSFVSYFRRSKVGWIERNRKRGIKQFQFIDKFRRGEEDRYMYFVAQWGYIISYLVFGVFFTVVLVYFKFSGLDRRYTIIIGVFAVIALSRSGWVLLKLHLWYWRINHFDEYKDAFTKKFGDQNVR